LNGFLKRKPVDVFAEWFSVQSSRGDSMTFELFAQGMRRAQGCSGQFLSHCPYRGLGSVGDTDLAENMLSMLLNGLVADV
jgi:hypothetical protein